MLRYATLQQEVYCSNGQFDGWLKEQFKKSVYLTFIAPRRLTENFGSLFDGNDDLY